jgi:hypothetical protein
MQINPGPKSSTGNRGYEPRDANAKGILIAAGCAIVAAALMHVLLYFYYSKMANYLPVPRPVLAADKSDISPHGPFVNYEQEQQRQLQSYGWIDRSNGVAQIPIERAMQLLAERGLPVRSNAGNLKSPLELQQERATNR